jgi:ABC-2 type transport system ATP-binding protein
VSAEASLAAAALATPTAVATSGLTKRFRSGQVAVDGIDLAVPTGAVYGFLGPNGSGKTTTIRLLLGLLRPTAGSASLLGRPMPDASADVLPRVGALVEGPAFHPYLSGWDNLMRLDACDRTADPRTARDRVTSAMDRVGLTAASAKRYRHYSLGMRQRLGIAAALLRPRDLLVLDEPTNGLDPQGTREVRGLLVELAAAGTTVCTHVGVMHRGRLVAQDALPALRAGSATRAVVTTPQARAAAAVLVDLGLADVDVHPPGASAVLGTVEPSTVVAALVHADVPVDGFQVSGSDLEELFVSLTGEGFDVNG